MDLRYDPNLMLYLPLYELDGASFMSRDKHGHLATVTGALWRPQGRWCDGIDDLITIPEHALLNFGTGNFTLVFWYKCQGTFGTYGTWYQALFYKAAGNIENNPGWALYTHGGDTNLTFVVKVAGQALQGFGAISFPIDVWVQGAVTVSRVGTDMTVLPYSNGVAGSPTTATVNGSLDNTASLKIYQGVNTLQGAGVLGEAWLYKGLALSTPEIQRNYLATRWRYQ